MSRASESRLRRRLARQFQREAGTVTHLDIVPINDLNFRPAIFEWARGATADNPGLCLLGCDARFGPGHGAPRLVAFIRAIGGTIAMGGGICGRCAEQPDLEHAALAGFGITTVRLIDAVHVSAEGGTA